MFSIQSYSFVTGQGTLRKRNILVKIFPLRGKMSSKMSLKILTMMLLHYAKFKIVFWELFCFHHFPTQVGLCVHVQLISWWQYLPGMH